VQRCRIKGTITLGMFLRVNLEISAKGSSMINISLLYRRNTSNVFIISLAKAARVWSWLGPPAKSLTLGERRDVSTNIFPEQVSMTSWDIFARCHLIGEGLSFNPALPITNSHSSRRPRSTPQWACAYACYMLPKAHPPMATQSALAFHCSTKWKPVCVSVPPFYEVETSLR
jgi:hypothetical protein